MSIDQRVAQSGNDPEKVDQLITEYMPFIASCTARLCGVADPSDRDEYSIALAAFEEAIRTYHAEKGGFLAFAKHVIRRRLIDYWRKNNRHNRLTSIESFRDGKDDFESDFLNDKAVDDYRKARERENIRLEIEQYAKELQAWGIALESLSGISPKHTKSRQDCRKIIQI